MYFLKNYYQNIIQYDLINKFQYKNTKNLPQLQKIVLNFGYKNPNINILASSLLALELIASKRGTITTSKDSHILLKIRKGNPVGCKVILKKTLMYNFFAKLLIDIFPQVKEFKEFRFNKETAQKNTFSYKLKNTFVFSGVSILNSDVLTREYKKFLKASRQSAGSFERANAFNPDKVVFKTSKIWECNFPTLAVGISLIVSIKGNKDRNVK